MKDKQAVVLELSLRETAQELQVTIPADKIVGMLCVERNHVEDVHVLIQNDFGPFDFRDDTGKRHGLTFVILGAEGMMRESRGDAERPSVQAKSQMPRMELGHLGSQVYRNRERQ